MASFLKGRNYAELSPETSNLPYKAKKNLMINLENVLKIRIAKNHQIITWFRNTSVAAIYEEFGYYESAKEIWDMLKKRYVTSDLTFRYHLRSILCRMTQEPGQSIRDFYAQIRSIWDQIALSEPVWDTTEDAQKFQQYRNEDRLI